MDKLTLYICIAYDIDMEARRVHVKVVHVQPTEFDSLHPSVPRLDRDSDWEHAIYQWNPIEGIVDEDPGLPWHGDASLPWVYDAFNLAVGYAAIEAIIKTFASSYHYYPVIGKP